jgi:hypothetical protein
MARRNVEFIFENQRLDADRRELRRCREPIPVEPQVFDLLVYLVQNHDRVVSKDDLIASVWSGHAAPGWNSLGGDLGKPKSGFYLRTQITRTTEAFASGDPAELLTPLALRNSRTVPAGTSTACTAFAGPATTAGFNSATPANLPSLSSAAAPEKPSAGAGVSTRSLPACVAGAVTLQRRPPPPAISTLPTAWLS